MNKKFFVVLIATMLLTVFMAALTVSANGGCVFTDNPSAMTLELAGDCTTDETIYIPDGYTLLGNDYSITAVDPLGGHFTGAVVQNAGSVAHVYELGVTASGLANVCDGGANRLRGIMFDGASGSIEHSTVVGINQGNSGCQEGNAVEIRNAPFDGTHPNTVYVDVTNNWIDDYQKTGVVCNGDVNCSVNRNYVGSADLDDYIAANSVQFGWSATGSINNNEIVGNDWDGNPFWVGTAVLLYSAGDVNIKHNDISGVGTDVGVYAYSSGTVNVMNNVIVRDPEDGGLDEFGYGVYFSGNSGKSKLVHNTFSGWLTDYEGADLDNVNSTLP